MERLNEKRIPSGCRSTLVAVAVTSVGWTCGSTDGRDIQRGHLRMSRTRPVCHTIESTLVVQRLLWAKEWLKEDGVPVGKRSWAQEASGAVVRAGCRLMVVQLPHLMLDKTMTPCV